MSVCAFVFPGQGSQKPGMGAALSDAFSCAREVFDEVDDALSFALSRLIREGPEETLTLTENAQPALMAVSLAVMRVLEREGGVVLKDRARFVAGHSLGEYTALAAAGSFSLRDTARLLRLRGQAMQAAVPPGAGAMAALLGAEPEQAEDIAERAQASVPDGVCVAANDNAPGQIVISGDTRAVEAAIELAKTAGIKRAMRLPVSAPFHSPLMAPAADAMRDALKDIAMRAPVVPVIANVTAAPVSDVDEIKALLVKQVVGRVQWRQSVSFMAAEGVDTLIEVGAGRILSGMTRRIDKALNTHAIETPEEIEAFLKTEGT